MPRPYRLAPLCGDRSPRSGACCGLGSVRFAAEEVGGEGGQPVEEEAAVQVFHFVLDGLGFQALATQDDLVARHARGQGLVRGTWVCRDP